MIVVKIVGWLLLGCVAIGGCSMIAPTQQICTHEDRFLEMLPTLLRVIRHRLRNQPRRDREELVAEALAAAFVMYARLVQRGKQDSAFPTPLVLKPAYAPCSR